MQTKLAELKKSIQHDLSGISNSEELKHSHIRHLGRKGTVNALFRQMKDLSPEETRSAGQLINQLKLEVEEIFKAKEQELKQKASSKNDSFDKTLPGTTKTLGNLHPTTQTIRLINSFFRYQGYSVYEGPEIETDDNVFVKLNLPPHHPARGLQDTLYIKSPEWLLRTQTSSIEIHAMTNEELPIRIVAPGKVYRNETSNLTNNSVFYQYEGLVVDKDINMGHLKWTLNQYVKFLYGPDTKTRLRCKYYPQVEPGAGMDIQCTFCHGAACSVCKYRGWVEVLGSGMVHPNVLRSCGINPDEYSGFAFGLGLDRLVMLKFGIDDVRKLYSGELVFDSL